MEAFIKELYEQLDRELHSVCSDINAVHGYNLKTELAEEAIKKIRNYLCDHPFPGNDIEISYFKFWAPRFFKLQILYTSLYNLELSRITMAGMELFKEYLEKKIRRAHRFLKRHEELRIYYLMSETNRDRELFVCTCPSKTEDFLTANSFYCKNSIVLAKIMAYEDFLSILTNELNNLEGKKEDLTPDSHKRVNEYRWEASKAQATELIYAIVRLKCVSVEGRDADIKDMAAFFKERLGLNIDNIYDVELHNKKRKKEKAPFLNALLDAYLAPDK